MSFFLFLISEASSRIKNWSCKGEWEVARFSNLMFRTFFWRQKKKNISTLFLTLAKKGELYFFPNSTDIKEWQFLCILLPVILHTTPIPNMYRSGSILTQVCCPHLCLKNFKSFVNSKSKFINFARRRRKLQKAWHNKFFGKLNLQKWSSFLESKPYAKLVKLDPSYSLSLTSTCKTMVRVTLETALCRFWKPW